MKVRFSYPSRKEVQILDSFSLDIAVGTKAGVNIFKNLCCKKRLWIFKRSY